MLRKTRRAPAACAWCNHRKVRCDAALLGCPCTRCRQDGRTDCALRPRPPKPHVDTTRSHGDTDVDSKFRSQKKSQSAPQGQGGVAIRTQSTVLMTEDTTGDAQDQLSRNYQNIVDLYPFLSFDSLDTLPREDVAFFFSKDCFSIPRADDTREFIEQYFKKIHPGLPILDEAEFWRIFDRTSANRLSIFVFQALLFVSCPFVSLCTLQRAGFVDKRDARKQLYTRAKLLYDLKAEKMPSAQAQGALLLTHHTSAEAPRAGSSWLSRAIESALSIDAQPPIVVESFTESMQKRLWWSILLRDRSLCIGLRRRPQITSLNFRWYRSFLGEEDFEDEIFHSQVYDCTVKRMLIAAFQEQCHLASVLTDLVVLVFSPRPAWYTPEAFYNAMSTVETIKNSLVGMERRFSNSVNDPCASIRNITLMYYHAARVDLAHFTALLVEENMCLVTKVYSEIVTEIANDLQSGITGLTNVMGYFSMSGQEENIPLSVLGYVGMPLVLAAIDLKLSPSNTEMHARQHRINSPSKLIRYSESLYDVTDFVAAGTNHILQLAYLTTRNFPLQCGMSDNSNKICNIPSDRVSAGTRRARGWCDFFRRCPRAYLLISTSVDYSLAVGRLPYDSSLPTLVRRIPGAITRLPWTVGSSWPEAASINAREPQQQEDMSSSSPASGTSNRSTGTESHTQQSPSKNGTSDGGENLVNLDFLDLDTDWGWNPPFASEAELDVFAGPHDNF